MIKRASEAERGKKLRADKLAYETPFARKNHKWARKIAFREYWKKEK